ncbi:MAG: FHA domain-containing protein [Aggregatilineaceae bacterium]
MDRIILTITSELFDEADRRQEVSVRANLTVRALIEEIRREFNLLDAGYRLTLAGQREALPLDRTMEQLGLQTGAELVFERDRHRLDQRVIARGGQYFEAVSQPGRARLREAASGQTFSIEWQPAIIGRPDAANPATAQALAVDVSALAEGRTVSRRHAQITERGGTYYLEALNERNPTLLNGQALAFGERRALSPGDRIRVGLVDLVFEVPGAAS